jgi:tetratricopeptide (TPR) repeat protein
MNASANTTEARVRAVLNANPEDPQAKCLLAAMFLRQRQWSEAGALLDPLSRSQPQMEFVWRGLGQALARLGERERATEAVERALDLELRGKEAWYLLGSLLTFPDSRDAEQFGSSAAFCEVVSALADDCIDTADALSRAAVECRADHPVALKLRADVLIQESRWPEAKALLERSLEGAPDYLAARFRYATMLFAHSAFAECVPQMERLFDAGYGIALLRGAKALALALQGDYAHAVAEFATFIEASDFHPGLWHEYGKVLRWNGDRRMGAAFRKATEILPSYSAAWYALATVKSFRWTDALAGELRNQLARTDVAIDDRALLHFVLGKALEDLARYDEAFAEFRASKQTLRSFEEYSPKLSQTAWRRTRLLFTPAFLRRYAGAGSAARDPIFVVGMPRAGSTLVEQILSAHSRIEGLGELSTLPSLVEKLYGRAGGPQHWPMLLQRLKPGDFDALGEAYLSATRALRKTSAPFFTDKLPNNFQLIGLIHLMLPNAKIIDVRRHPLDCGFSCFKHYFPKGHRFACDLADIGNRYVDYVQLMAHFDAVLPGKVYRVTYETLVGNFEAEVRRLLAFLALPFEPQCLQFFENRRTVMTLSYEQVFMPLYGSGIGHWRHYEKWLGPLKNALGDVLEIYPHAPKFFADVHAWSRRSRSLGEGGRFGMVKGLQQRPFTSRSDVPLA